MTIFGGRATGPAPLLAARTDLFMFLRDYIHDAPHRAEVRRLVDRVIAEAQAAADARMWFSEEPARCQRRHPASGERCNALREHPIHDDFHGRHAFTAADG